MNLTLDFAQDGQLKGEGTDEVGAFVISGNFGADECHWSKFYRTYSVRYAGLRSGNGCISGTWELDQLCGTFYIRPTACGDGEVGTETVAHPEEVTASLNRSVNSEFQSGPWTGWYADGNQKQPCPHCGVENILPPPPLNWPELSKSLFGVHLGEPMDAVLSRIQTAGLRFKIKTDLDLEDQYTSSVIVDGALDGNPQVKEMEVGFCYNGAQVQKVSVTFVPDADFYKLRNLLISEYGEPKSHKTGDISKKYLNRFDETVWNCSIGKVFPLDICVTLTEFIPDREQTFKYRLFCSEVSQQDYWTMDMPPAELALTYVHTKLWNDTLKVGEEYMGRQWTANFEQERRAEVDKSKAEFPNL